MLKFIAKKRPSPWKGLLGGVVGGLAATIVMTQFQNAWIEASEKINSNTSDHDSMGHSRQPESDEDTVMKTAGRVAQIAGYQLSREQKKKASPFIHYGFGTLMGGLYGVAVESRQLRKQQPVLLGAGFGAGLFILTDEIAIPALNLSGESGSSIGTHLYGLASHLVYGMTAEGVRRLTRSVF